MIAKWYNTNAALAAGMVGISSADIRNFSRGAVSRVCDGEKEGEAFLKNTQIWVCTVCGFAYVGDSAPELCPVCKVPAWKFEKIEGRV